MTTPQRPSWCPHSDCIFQRQTQELICGGKLPKPEPHDGDYNDKRVCVKWGHTTDYARGVFDLQVNDSDLDWFRWIYDALDGKETSCLSKRGGRK